ncbi:hypothetical protein [Phormidesmis sp. 146-33]
MKYLAVNFWLVVGTVPRAYPKSSGNHGEISRRSSPQINENLQVEKYYELISSNSMSYLKDKFALLGQSMYKAQSRVFCQHHQSSGYLAFCAVRQ